MEIKVRDDHQQYNPTTYAGHKVGHAGFIDEVLFLINKESCNEQPIRNMNQNIF